MEGDIFTGHWFLFAGHFLTFYWLLFSLGAKRQVDSNF